MKKTVIFCLLAATALSCKSLLPDEITVVQLGIAPDAVEVDAAAGEDGVRVISDRDYAVKVVSGAEWLSVGVTLRDSLSFHFTENSGFRRSAVLSVSADGREDRLEIRQGGVFHESVSLSEHGLSFPASGGTATVRLHSNMPSDVFRVECTHSEAFKVLRLRDYVLSLEVLPTTNRDKRSYEIRVYCVDGWGKEISDTIAIVQDAFE